VTENLRCTALSYTDFPRQPAVSYMDFHADHVRLTRMCALPLGCRHKHSGLLSHKILGFQWKKSCHRVPKLWIRLMRGWGRCSKVTLQTHAPVNFRLCWWEDKRTDRDQGPPPAWAEFQEKAATKIDCNKQLYYAMYRDTNLDCNYK
jgi:hypothetical protein